MSRSSKMVRFLESQIATGDWEALPSETVWVSYKANLRVRKKYFFIWKVNLRCSRLLYSKSSFSFQKAVRKLLVELEDSISFDNKKTAQLVADYRGIARERKTGTQEGELSVWENEHV